MPTQVSLLDGALASAGTLAIQTNGTTSAITISSAQVATFVNNPIMTGLTASRAVFTDGSKGLTSNAITGTGNVVMSASPTLTGTIDGAALTLSSSLTLSGGTANGVLYLNGSKVATSGSALTFDGTTVATTGKFGISGSGAVPSASAIEIGTNGAGSRMLFNVPTGGEHNFMVNGSLASWVNATSSGWYISGSEAMRLTSTGLGIGTSSPTNALTVGTTSAGKNIAIYSSSNGNNGLLRLYDLSGTERLQLSGNSTGEAVYYAPTGSVHAWYVNTERMRLDSSGNLGLGVTPSAWFANRKALQIGGSVGVVAASGLSFDQYTNGYIDASTVERYYQTGAASKFSAENGAFKWHTAASGTAGNAITFTQAMTLDASGNLGVGTTSPSVKLHVNNGSILVDNGAGAGTLYLNSTSNFINQTGTSSMQFGVNGAERARIDSSGNLLVGTTVAPTGASTSGLQLRNVSGAIGRIDWGKTTSGTQTGGSFYHSGTQVGTITYSDTATAYNTSSDYRLKENIQPMQNALGVVAQLNPVTYNWKADGSAGQGFIAHELQAVVPDCVTGAKDAVDEDGNPVYQGIDTSFLVATLTAAIKELKAEFDAYKATHP